MIVPPVHWLDTNVFIEAQNGYYALDLVPKFWAWLEKHLNSGLLKSSTGVYRELVARPSRDDALYVWAKARRKSAYWVPPTKEVQGCYGEIAAYVQDHYARANPASAGNFLAKADGWIIAHAKASGGTVVTQELRVGPDCQTPKIPNVCTHFGVPCIGTTDMLRRFNFKL